LRPDEKYIDPLHDREPPPLPTVVVFPAHESLQPDKSWPQNPPDLIKQFTNVNKPYDLKPEHLKVLNIDTCDDVPLEDFIPDSSDGLRHLPPREWGKDVVGRDVVPGTASRRNSAASYEIFAHDKYPLLSNGVHAPNEETYVKFAAELVCDTDDGLRVVQRQKPHPGHKAPVLSQYRKFWGVLDTMSTYWDSSMDTYFESKTRPVPVRTASGTKLFRGLLSGHSHQHKDSAVSIPATQSATKRYRGRRTDTGSSMPDHIRSDCIRNFIDPVATAFGCTTAVPRKSPQVKVKNMLVPVTQTIAVWRNPQDKSQAKGGYLEGPVLGVSSRGSTNFIANDTAATVDTAREIGGLLLLAQERHREGRNKTVPGQGKWYTTKPRWGGGPGGEFGSGEKNANGATSSTKSANSSAGAGHSVSIKWRPSDEFIWKQLKAQPGLWEIGKTYLAIGKERGSQYDDVSCASYRLLRHY